VEKKLISQVCPKPIFFTLEEIKSGIKKRERKVYPEERATSVDDG
jgi:hypothetical protein